MRALLVPLLFLVPLVLPSAQAGAPDEVCDVTGLLVCANVAELIAVHCAGRDGRAVCIIWREIEFLAGSPSGLPGGADATSEGSVRACVGAVCSEHALDLAILSCDFGVEQWCLLHATLLPLSLEVPLADGECVVVTAENATQVVAGTPARVPAALVTATATTSTVVEQTVCA